MSRDSRWMREALALMDLCPPSRSAYSVGAVIVDSHDKVVSSGYSRERPHAHAEESALEKIRLSAKNRLTGATIYSTLEPCTTRQSAPFSCTELILTSGIRRIVIAWREPNIFADCDGVEQLRSQGREVIELVEFGAAAQRPNQHVLDEHSHQ